VLRALAPSESVAALLAPGDGRTILERLEQPEPVWSAGSRDALLTETLSAAMEDCTRLMGPEPSAWAWGRLHRLLFAHALGRVLPEAEGHPLDIGSVPIGGSASTVCLSEYRPEDFGVTIGASFRMVLDVGDWDLSVAINAPGQSGDPASPHYTDLVDHWAEGVCVPLPYSTAAVDAAAQHRIRLLPAAICRGRQ
jgi:penicillin amidase